MIALSLGESQRFAVVASPAYLAGRPTPLVPTDLVGHVCIRVRYPMARFTAGISRKAATRQARKSVGSGKGVSGRVDPGGRRTIKKKTTEMHIRIKVDNKTPQQ